MNGVVEERGVRAGAERERVGDARFVSAGERGAAAAALAVAGLVVAVIEPIEASARGRLGEVIDEAIERGLQSRGAVGQGLIGASSFASYRDAALSDQLFRARRAGASGVAVVLGPLRQASGTLGILDPEDTATLSFLVQASRERALVLS